MKIIQWRCTLKSFILKRAQAETKTIEYAIAVNKGQRPIAVKKVISEKIVQLNQVHSTMSFGHTLKLQTSVFLCILENLSGKKNEKKKKI